MAAKKSASTTKPHSKKTAAKPRSLVTFLLDRSGSMAGIHNQTIEGYNAFLAGLQEEKNAEILFTFLQFDNVSLDKIHVAVPVGKVPNMRPADFVPRGGTPLIDAAYKTIKAVEDAVAHEERKPKVVVCIQTDGEENQSQEHTWADLSALVKAKQELGWQFNFMGAGIDAYQQAARMGLGAGATISYSNNLGATRAAFAASANNASGFSTGVLHETTYTSSQKGLAEDAFDPHSLAEKLKKATGVQSALGSGK